MSPRPARGRRSVERRILIAFLAVALPAALLACGGDANGGRPTLAEWAGEVCGLSVVAADTLEVPGPDNPEALTLEERKQRAADVLAPRAEALGDTADELAAVQPPDEAAAFHDVLQATMTDVSTAWLDLVAEAEGAQSSDELNAANDVWLQAQEDADGQVVAAYEALPGEAAAALSEPDDCGILNDVRS